MNKKEKLGNEPSLILQLNNNKYNQLVINDVLEFKTTGNFPNHIGPETRFINIGFFFYLYLSL